MRRAGWIAALAIVLVAAPAQAGQRLVPPPVPPGVVEGPAGWMLVTGDSMMSVMEHELAAELTRYGAGVRMDSRVGSGITKTFLFDWVPYAGLQARVVAPRATVVFLGAGDVYALRVGRREVRWGTRAWRDAYARRVHRMLRSYRGPAGDRRVYWLTLPAAKDAGMARAFRTINAALATAVRRAGEGAELVDLRPLIAPRGRFRRTLVVDGRRQVVRQSDGVHLAHAGALVASREIRAALQADGLLPPAPLP